jgi:Domain of unknown function (DUF4383)
VSIASKSETVHLQLGEREAHASRSADRIAPLLAYAFCLTTGPFLFIDGLLGLIFAGTSLRTGEHLPHRSWNFIVQFNSWHQLAHVVTGGILILAATRRGWLPVGLLVFGAFYAVAAPLGFIDGNDVLDVIYSDTRDNIIHALFAALALGLGVLVVRRRLPASGTHTP